MYRGSAGMALALAIAWFGAAAPNAIRTASAQELPTAAAPLTTPTVAGTPTTPAGGETPTTTPTPSMSTSTPPSLSETPLVSSTVSAPTPGVGVATISASVAVDMNGNGVFDREDLPAATGVSLVAWNLVPEQPSVAVKYWFTLLMEDDTFSFTNLPAGRYSLRVYWIGGWVLGGIERSPDIWLAIFDVHESGEITAPDPATLPEFLPDTYRGARIDIAGDHIWLGEPPDVLLALPKEPGVFPYPVDSSVGEAAIGTLDVARAMRGELPAAGTGPGAGDRTTWLPLMLLGLVTASAAAFAFRSALRT